VHQALALLECLIEQCHIAEACPSLERPPEHPGHRTARGKCGQGAGCQLGHRLLTRHLQPLAAEPLA
jgi:hypothetical protein